MWKAPTRFKTLFIKPASKIISRVDQNWAKLSLLVHTSMPPLGTDGVGGDLSKGPVAMDPDRAIHPREPRQTRRHPHPARALPTELAPPGLIKMRSVSPPLTPPRSSPPRFEAA